MRGTVRMSLVPAALLLVLSLAVQPVMAQPPGSQSLRPGDMVGDQGPGMGPGKGPGSGPGMGQSGPGGGSHHGPPQEAIDACRGKEAGDACTMRGPGAGQCVALPGGMDRPGEVACVPKARLDAMGPGVRAEHYPDPGEKTDLLCRNATATYGGVPDTGQEFCFSETRVVPCPGPDSPLYGQDAQYDGPGPSYRDNGDGTAKDLVTGLTWETAHHAKRLPYYAAQDYCQKLSLGGQDDWRLPSLKELYSLIMFDGRTGGKPFLYDKVFRIEPPSSEDMGRDPTGTHFPNMMGQTWTSTLYVGNLWDRSWESAFFVNFLDGRIKCAPTGGPNGMFYRCVRGPAWGANDFVDNHNGTVSDRALGLMWQQQDNGQGVEWPEALAYCQNLELAGHDDWRLPNAKELETIVDYSRPQPAIDTGFFRISDPTSWFWTSTTHGETVTDACYICFGKCVSADGVDVHGAGAQRSDPKTMAQKKVNSRGGQDDEIRVLNYARCVRDLTSVDNEPASTAE